MFSSFFFLPLYIAYRKHCKEFQKLSVGRGLKIQLALCSMWYVNVFDCFPTPHNSVMTSALTELFQCHIGASEAMWCSGWDWVPDTSVLLQRPPDLHGPLVVPVSAVEFPCPGSHTGASVTELYSSLGPWGFWVLLMGMWCRLNKNDFQHWESIPGTHKATHCVSLFMGHVSSAPFSVSSTFAASAPGCRHSRRYRWGNWKMQVPD